MKHIKIYENTIKPKLGDYVICYEKINIGTDWQEDFMNFLSSNIGIGYKSPVTDVYFYYLVQYYDIPYDLSGFFNTYDKKTNTRPMHIDEIVEFSENKKDLDSYVVAKKYNL